MAHSVPIGWPGAVRAAIGWAGGHVGRREAGRLTWARAGAGRERSGSRERPAGLGPRVWGAGPPGLAMLGARGTWGALRRCASVPRAVRLRVREALRARQPADAVRVQVCVPGSGPGVPAMYLLSGGERDVGALQSVLLSAQISSAVVLSLPGVLGSLLSRPAELWGRSAHAEERCQCGGLC